MAAIDPTASPVSDPKLPNAPPRATLKMIRHYAPLDFDDDDDSDEDDEDDEDIDEDDVAEIERKLGLLPDSDSEGLSEDDAEPAPKAVRAAKLLKKLNGVDEDVDMDAAPNGINGIKKGKATAADEDEDDEDEDEDDDEDIIDLLDDEDDQELPLCTLDTTHHYQQALDLTIMDPRSVSFTVIGTHSIFLTGNFVEVPQDDSDDEDDEMGLANGLEYGAYDDLLAPYGESDSEDDDEIDSEEDELDDLDDPRIEELGTDEDEAAPKLVKAKGTPAKGKNKRPAESEDEEVEDLDNLISKTLKAEDAAQVNGDQKLSKKQMKKLKKNDGQAAPVADDVKKSATKDSPANGKKVQFAKELEQGPTPTKTEPKKEVKKEAKSQSKGVRVVQGVTIDERKEGSGPGAKKGDRVGMRYIGKIEKDSKVFDSNKKGKPFTFKLGAGEVIKGWDTGLQGVKVGSERRITIPPSMGYGSQKLPDIPPNSTLIFDVKCLSLN